MSVFFRLSIVFVLCLCLLCGCSTDADDQNSHSPSTQGNVTLSKENLSLAFSSSDSLNPYKAKSKSNNELVNLLFDALVKINDNFEPTYCLAEKIELADTLCTITIKNTSFTDGTAVTASDVAYSLGLAMNAEKMQYSENLKNVYTYTVKSPTVFTIELYNSDEYFTNFLDFPILKFETDEKTDQDNLEIPPVGSGRYIYKEGSGHYWLEANDNWYGGAPKIKRIELVNLPDDDAINHAVRSGDLDVFYSDLNSDTFPTMTGTNIYVPMNNLVFLGVNTSGGVLSDINIRRAISYALDRSELIKTAFYGESFIAKGPCHINFDDASGFQSLPDKTDTQKAIENLELSGYSVNQSQKTATKDGSSISITLVYNSGNHSCTTAASLIASDLSNIGIKVIKKGFSGSQYASAISSYSFDLYLGELKIPANMNLYPLLTAGGLIKPTAMYIEENKVVNDVEATPKSSDISNTHVLSAADAAKNMNEGKGSLAEVLSCFNHQLPIIPLIHRNGMLCYSNKIAEGLSPVANDPYNGIENCTLS